MICEICSFSDFTRHFLSQNDSSWTSFCRGPGVDDDGAISTSWMWFGCVLFIMQILHQRHPFRTCEFPLVLINSWMRHTSLAFLVTTQVGFITFTRAKVYQQSTLKIESKCCKIILSKFSAHLEMYYLLSDIITASWPRLISTWYRN